MKEIEQAKSISVWIFIVPFVALNLCLFIVTQFHGPDLSLEINKSYELEWWKIRFLMPKQEDVLLSTFPYIDGGASISRTARVYPTYYIFKPAMFLTSYLLIKYWMYNKKIILNYDAESKYVKKILFFGIGSAILLTIHSIFLGIKFDYDLYKLFRRVVMLLFIIFEIIAQAYLVLSLYKIKGKLNNLINLKILKTKRFLVTTLIIVALIAIPILTQSGFKHFKHALEWNYFLGVISFYLLTFFMWKKTN